MNLDEFAALAKNPPADPDHKYDFLAVCQRAAARLPLPDTYRVDASDTARVIEKLLDTFGQRLTTRARQIKAGGLTIDQAVTRRAS
jgi:hypothetical protein